jgi:hypothetical protein
MSSKLGSNALASKWRAGFGLGCLSGIATAVLGVIVLGVIVRSGPERFPGPIRSLYGADGTIVTGGESGGSSLSLEQIRAIRGVQPTIQVTLTEEDINTYLQENPGAVGLPKDFSKPRVRFNEGRVRLLVSTKVFLFSTRIAIGMAPSIQDGQLKLEVKQIEAGGIDLPGELRQIAEERVADLLADRLGEAGLRPESATVEEGRLTVSARLVPVDAPLEPEVEESEEPAVDEEAADEGTREQAAEGKTEDEDEASSGAREGRDWWPGR